MLARKECFLCDKTLEQGHLEAIRNAIKVSAIIGVHVERVTLKDYLCPECHEFAAGFQTLYDAWKSKLQQLFDEIGFKDYVDTDDDSFKEFFDDGESPKEAFATEISYWDDDGDE